MRRGLFLPWLFALAFGQALLVPGEAPVGKPAAVRGEALPPGTYALEVELPGGGERVLTVEAGAGRFELPFVPEAPGAYRFRLRLDGEVLEGVLQAVLPPPRLTASGLWLGPRRTLALPDPERWLGPVSAGTKAYVARGLLVLEVDRLSGEVRRHYPPSPVKRLFEGPELLLADGRRLGLDELSALPFEAPWSELPGLAELERALGPYDGERPYWSLLAEGRTDPEALSAMGRDLFARGHRAELAWGEDHPFGPLLVAAEVARDEGLERSLALTRFLFDHVPLVPGSEAFFARAADWLWAQGRLVEAERLREGIGWIRHYRRLGLARYFLVALVFFAAGYLALLLKGLLAGGRWPGGGLSFLERILLVAFLVLAATAALGYGVGREVEARMTAFGRASLETLAAREALRALPEGPEREALLSGRGRAPSAALLLAGGEPGAALALDSASGTVRDRLGLGGDPWSRAYREALGERPLVPSDRELELTLALAHARALLARPWPALAALAGSPPLLVLYLAVFLVLLLHALVALVRGEPRRPGVAVYLLAVLVPGLLWFAHGVGVLLFGLALAAAGLTLAGAPVGPGLLVAAYALNLLGVALAFREARR